MSWYSDILSDAADAYSANQNAAANQSAANAAAANAAAANAAANAANANKPNWVLIGGIAGAVLLVLALVLGRK